MTAVTAQPTAILAFLAGLASFLSPCVLPLVPGFLAFLGGTAPKIVFAEARSEQGAGAANGNSSGPSTFRLLVYTISFVLGFTAVFTVLGTAVALGGSLFAGWTPVFELLAGAVVILLGLNMVFGFIPALFREVRVHTRRSPVGPLGAFLIGLAFGAGWTPCIGPMLAAILLMVGVEGSGITGTIYLLLYSLGLGLPFVLASLGAARFGALQRWLRRYSGRVQLVSGIVLTLLGLMIASGSFQRITAWVLSFSSAIEQLALSQPELVSLIAVLLFLFGGFAPLLVWVLGQCRQRRGGAKADGGVSGRLPIVVVVIALAGVLLAALELAGVLRIAHVMVLWFGYQGI